jgi:hypothetical protein
VFSIRPKRGDAVFTPAWCAADMVRHFRPQGRVLEPCAGDGVFLRYLPQETEWCEIEKGRDFFARTEPTDWIITNPPYSKTRPFLRHALTLAEEIVFLVPARNIFSGYGCVRECAGWGRMREIRWYGTGGRLGFPMGNAVAAIRWSKGYSGPIYQSFYEDERSLERSLRQLEDAIGRVGRYLEAARVLD